MFDSDHISDFFADGGSPENEGIFRAQKLQENIIKIAEIAAEAEMEALGAKTTDFYKQSIEEVVSGKYKPQTLDSFMGTIDTSLYFLFGDLPGQYYVAFVKQIVGDIVNLFVETYAFFLKTAFENAILVLEKETDK